VPDYTSLNVQVRPGYASISDPREKARTKGGGKRGVIRDFSKQARLRLMKKLMSLSQAPKHFVTLTYPAVYPADSSEWKNHLDNFFRVLHDRFPGHWFVWKLEPQKRGAPHFHLMGDLGIELDAVGIYRLLRAIWSEVVGATGENGRKHFFRGVQVENLQDSGHKKTSIYISKYVGKPQDVENMPEWSRPGRFWGVSNRKNMPAFQWDQITLPQSCAVWLKRLVKRWMKRRSRRYSRQLSTQHSYSIFSHPELMRKILFWILGPYQFQRWRSDREYANLYFYDSKNEWVDDCPF